MGPAVTFFFLPSNPVGASGPPSKAWVERYVEAWVRIHIARRHGGTHARRVKRRAWREIRNLEAYLRTVERAHRSWENWTDEDIRTELEAWKSL